MLQVGESFGQKFTTFEELCQKFFGGFVQLIGFGNAYADWVTATDAFIILK